MASRESWRSIHASPSEGTITAPSSFTELASYLPAAVVGEVKTIEPIRLGLSGAGVYAVTAESGAYVLRVHGAAVDDSFWEQHLRILRRDVDAHRSADARGRPRSANFRGRAALGLAFLRVGTSE